MSIVNTGAPKSNSELRRVPSLVVRIQFVHYRSLQGAGR